MLGPPKARDLDRPVLISLDAASQGPFLSAPPSRPRPLFRPRSRRRLLRGGGRPWIDPEVFFRLQLIMFFAGIRSERQLLEQAVTTSRCAGMRAKTWTNRCPITPR